MGLSFRRCSSFTLKMITATAVFAAIGSAMIAPSFAQAQASDPAREFLMSCTYGTMAGTLIGAATLAFEDKPSDNLNKVARGASIGLYAGILLGAYIVYVVPGMDDDDSQVAQAFTVLPTLNNLGHVDGAQANINFLSF